MNGSGARSTASIVDDVVPCSAGLCWLLVHAIVLFCSVWFKLAGPVSLVLLFIAFLLP
jgi:hypothetical protein